MNNDARIQVLAELDAIIAKLDNHKRIWKVIMNNDARIQVLAELDAITAKLDNHKRMMSSEFSQYTIDANRIAHGFYSEFHRSLIRIAEAEGLPIEGLRRDYSGY